MKEELSSGTRGKSLVPNTEEEPELSKVVSKTALRREKPLRTEAWGARSHWVQQVKSP